MKNILPFFALALFGMACSKDDSTSPVGGSSGCVIVETTDSADNKKTFSSTLDGNRRINRIDSYDDGVLRSYSTISYGSGTITIQGFNPGNVANRNPITYTVGTIGNILAGTNSQPDTVNGTAGVRKDTLTVTYTSDNKMLTQSSKSTTYANGTNAFLEQSRSSTTYTYNGNRLIKTVTTYSDKEGSDPISSSTTTEEYTYDESSPTVKINPVSISVGTLLGTLQADKIPVRKVSTYSSSSFVSENTTTYTAVIDANGNPTKIRSVRTYTGSSTQNISTSNYTYNCP